MEYRTTVRRKPDKMNPIVCYGVVWDTVSKRGERIRIGGPAKSLEHAKQIYRRHLDANPEIVVDAIAGWAF